VGKGDTGRSGVGGVGPGAVRHPGDVAPSWLTAVLCGAGVLTEGPVVAFTVSPLFTGQMGDSLRFRLELDPPRRRRQPPTSGPARSTDRRSRTRRWLSMAARYSSQSGCSPEIDR